MQTTQGLAPLNPALSALGKIKGRFIPQVSLILLRITPFLFMRFLCLVISQFTVLDRQNNPSFIRSTIDFN